MTSIEAASDEPDAWFKLDRDSRKLTVGGAWTIAESARLDRELNALSLGGRGDVVIDASKISRLDSSGAWLLTSTLVVTSPTSRITLRVACCCTASGMLVSAYFLNPGASTVRV